MKKLTVSIGSLGSAAAGDYVSFNIWQGKRLLVSDKIAGKHSGTFHREYDVDYTQGEHCASKATHRLAVLSG